VALGQPVWSRVDEAAHYDVIAQYAAGVYPHDSVTTIRPETLAVMEDTGVYGFVVDNAYARPDPEAGVQQMPTGLSDSQHVLWIRRHGWQYSYEAFQPPLYYAVAVPAWWIGDRVGGPLGAVYSVRIFDALLAALLAPLSLLIALRLWPGSLNLGWGAAVLTAALPGVALNLTSVTNDVLVSVLGATCLLVAISGTWSRRRVVLLGVLFGAALLTKTTAIGLGPALAIALLQRQRGGGWRPMLGAGAIAAAIVLPWIASNVAIYSEPITTREQLAMAAFPARTAGLDFWSVSTLHAFVTFWTGDPFLSLPLAVPLALLATLMSALALAGLARAERTQALAVVMLAAAGAALVSLTSPVLAAFNAPGRLAYVGVSAAMAVVVVGLWRELPSPRLRRAFVGGYAGLSLIGLALIVPPGPAPQYSGPPSAARETPLQSLGTFADVRINLIACVVDPSGNLWLGIGLENDGNTPAEWSQTGEIRVADSTIATSDYRRSTPFSMALAPGYPGFAGWLYFGPRDHLGGLGAATVRFRDIAVDGYRKTGDISIPTALC
jgi:MFS family permease